MASSKNEREDSKNCIKPFSPKIFSSLRASDIFHIPSIH